MGLILDHSTLLRHAKVNRPTMRTVAFRDLRIIDSERVTLKIKAGTPRWETTMTESGWKDLCRILGIGQRAFSTLEGVLDTKVQDIIRLVQQSTKNSNKEVTLLFDSERRISRIGEGRPSKYTPEQYLGLTDLLLNEDFNLKDHRMGGGGGLSTRILLPTERSIGIKNEAVKVGVHVDYDPITGIDAGVYLDRLVCTNGMTTGSKLMNINLDAATSPEEMYRMLFELDTNQLLPKYAMRVKRLQGVNLSVDEFRSIHGHLAHTYMQDASKWTGVLNAEQLERDYRKVGFEELAQMNSHQARRATTNVNAWDALNVMTDLASHEYNSKPTGRQRLATDMLAADLLTGTPHMTYAVPSPY